MTVTVTPGTRRLNLVYATRYDTARPADIREDLLGIRVWLSTTQGFNYLNVTPQTFGVGSSVSIEGLQSNTTYYLRYAFISKLDPEIFTVSAELSATTFSETVPDVFLSTPNPIFIQLKNTTNFNISQTTVTATIANISSPTYRWYIDGVLQSGVTTSSITISAFATGSSRVIKCEILSGGNVLVYDELSLFSVQEGSDSLAAGLLNDSQNISANSAGTLFSGQLPLSNQLVVLRGSTQLTSGVTYSKVSETDMTSTINASTGEITVTAVSATTSANATYRATIGSTTLDRKFTINVVKDGAQGVSGINTATVALYAKNTSSVTAPAAFSGTFTYTFSTAALSGGTLNGWSTTAPSIASGEFLWVRYAIASSNTSTDTILDTEFSSAVVSAVGGTNGTSPVLVSLSASNVTITTNTDGSGGSYSTATSGFNIFSGTTNVIGSLTSLTITPSTGVTFSYTRNGTAQTGFTTQQTVTVAGLSTLSVAISAIATAQDSGTLTIETVYAGSVYTTIFTVSKAKTGFLGIVTRIAYQLVTQSSSSPAYATSTTDLAGDANNPITVPTSGASVWTLTVPTATVGNVIWYSYGRYNPNPVAIQGIAAYTTQWSQPIAASIFQDIRSDNWQRVNALGQTVSDTPNVSDFIFQPSGQQGYYIERSSGSFFGSNVYLQGEIIAKGNTTTFAPTWQVGANVFRTRSGMVGFSVGGIAASEANQNIIKVGVTGYVPDVWDTSFSNYISTTSASNSRSAVLRLYRVSATPPTTFPSGNSTYTWSSDSFTDPATLNGWSKIPPFSGATGRLLWVLRKVVLDNTATSQTTVTWDVSSPQLISTYIGDTGGRTAVMELYKWSSAQPTTDFPTGSSTYTWADTTFTNPGTLNGWAKQPGSSVAGQNLWAITVRYLETSTGLSQTSITWPGATNANPNSAFNIGVFGKGEGTAGASRKGCGVAGTGDLVGVYASGLRSDSIPLVAQSFTNDSTSIAAQFNGFIQVAGITSTAAITITGTSNLTLGGRIIAGPVLSLQVSTSAPTSPTTGMFAVADRVNWDPAAKGSGAAYPVFYNGSTWNALY